MPFPHHLQRPLAILTLVTCSFVLNMFTNRVSLYQEITYRVNYSLSSPLLEFVSALS
ncbi:hypothetical protein L873DRAFT_310396 [Choiromyces venosus 120613-1]|uniref:Uncharacterized protein n=1 Tax=Choiromyces venosus 120613-1 TaxID=1336337 RepID=A0A3N4JC66_9PEZI|nr:hypothetical protein L873DRAFT_310396 [Choiromyces venosus 120613-1]